MFDVGGYLWNLIFISIPWQVWAGLVAVAVAAVIVLWRTGNKDILLILVGVLTLGLISAKAGQAGRDAERKRTQEVNQKVIDRAKDAREKQKELNSDPDHLRDDDGHRRD